MRLWIWLIVLLAMLGGGGYLGYRPALQYWEARNQPKWRFLPVEKGDLKHLVNATGKVEPVQRVSIGAVVSGPVEELLVDFNSPVTKGQLLARIDPSLYQSAEQRDQAMLKTRQAEVLRAQALLSQAENEEKRAQELFSANQNFISETELDQLRFNRQARQAECTVAETAVAQALAQLQNSTTNLSYTEIRSPVDGIIVERKVDKGQTLAAQFQTPEMFVVAPEMQHRMHIYASVDEADIGYIRSAQSSGQPVRFTVDAYPERIFDSGKIVQVRLSSKEEQSVITYPVIVETPNEDLSLLPGMTANLSFQIESRESVLRLPNAALRFYPDRKWVHPDDRPVLDGVDQQKNMGESNESRLQSAEETYDANRRRMRRHVWVVDGKLLRAREVTLGISDSRFTEMLEGNLTEGEVLVIGEQPKT
ncbi:MAG: efflux RND transporter periplasmic adaptor subunit [Pirellulaceae bacterium]|jgi:HlyD family secretion protein